MFQDADQPTPLGGFSGKAVAPLEGCKQGLLDDIFGQPRIPDAEQRASKQIVAVLVDPPFRVR
jgi:hypothetical protein